MSEFKFVDGKIVELIESEVIEDQVEANLQEELDQAQNEVNTHVSNFNNVEQQYRDAEAAAEAASIRLDEAKLNKESAEAALTKSLDRKNSWATALQLRQEQLDQQADDGDGNDTETEPSDGSEAVDVPVNVVSAEG
jgi:chromosome segregation ATPase